MVTRPEKTDEALIAEYISGDSHALNELITRYISPIYNYALLYSGGKDDAEDITQETFLKLWKNIGQYRVDTKFRPWLYRIAHNTAIDHIRKKRTTPFSFFDRKDGNFVEDTLAGDDPLPDELFAIAERKEALEHAVTKLAPRYREVLHFHYHDELTFDEISHILGKPLNTVKSQHRRALIILRTTLDDGFAPNQLPQT